MAVVPSTPLLLPVVAVGPDADLDPVRDASLRAVRWLLDSDPAQVHVLGVGALTRRHQPGARGSFGGFGVDVTVHLPGGQTPPTAGAPDVDRVVLPRALAVGAWLLGEVGSQVPATGVELAPDTDDAGYDAVVNELLDVPARQALLLVADGTARLTERAPGAFDTRAVSHAQRVSRAVAAADAAGLMGLDAALAIDLLDDGWPAWQVLGRLAARQPWAGTLDLDVAPLGVQYLVARWWPSAS